MPSNPIDKRNRLDEEVFTYQITKTNKVFIFWHGKQVAILSGKKAEDFITAISNAKDKEAQLLMAKATGHFKHGNEKANQRR